MTGLSGEDLFGPNMPGSCFKEAGDCQDAYSFKSHNFKSVESWSNYLGGTFGLGVSGGFGGFTASIDASIGSKVEAPLLRCRVFAI